MAGTERAAPTASQLRAAIDGGAAGDKVPFSDPAAAPLGVDDEAAGAAPTAAQVSESFRHEVDGRPPERDAHASASIPTAGLAVDPAPMRARARGLWTPYLLAAAGVLITGLVWLAMAGLGA